MKHTNRLILNIAFLVFLIAMLPCSAASVNELPYTATDYFVYSEDVLIYSDYYYPTVYEINGTLCGAVRTVAVAINAYVDYNHETSTVTFSNDKHTLNIALYGDAATFDGNAVTMDTPLFTADGTTFAPIEFVADCFEVRYFIDPVNEVIIFYSSDEIPTLPPYLSTQSGIHTKGSHYDMPCKVKFNGHRLISITNATDVLQENVDYTVQKNSITIKNEYLETLTDGAVTFVFQFEDDYTFSKQVALLNNLTLPYKKTDYSLYVEDVLIDIYYNPAIYEINGTLCGAMRTIAEAMHLRLNWNSSTYTAIFSNDKHTLSMQLNNQTVTFDGSATTIDTPLYDTNSVICVPIKLLADCFEVHYLADPTKNIVVIYSTDEIPTIPPYLSARSSTYKKGSSYNVKFNGYRLMNITHATDVLQENVDYTIQKDSITIKKEYLETLPAGVTTLVLQFEDNYSFSEQVAILNDLTLLYKKTDYGLYAEGKLVNTDSALYEINGELCGSLRTVANAMRLWVDWNDSISTVTFSTDEHTLSMQLNNYTVTFDNNARTIDTPLYVINGTTFAPIKFLADCFEYKYSLDIPNNKCSLEKIRDYHVNLSVGEGGTVSQFPDRGQENGSIQLTIRPNYGYVIKNVRIDNETMGAISHYTINNITADVQVVVEFAKVNVSLDENGIMISSDAELEARLILATYRTDGTLSQCETHPVFTKAGESYQQAVAFTPNTTIMLWDGLDALRPIWSSKNES